MTPNISLVENAARADGFIDFYALIGAAPDAPDAALQEGINALYQEAQTHRDHRVPARRREYQLLLEVLPPARTILLDPARRKRYNAYCQAVAMESQRIAYPEFLATLLREREVAETRSEILTLSDLSRLRPTAPAISPPPLRLTEIESAPPTLIGAVVAKTLPHSKAVNGAANPVAKAENPVAKAENAPELSAQTPRSAPFASVLAMSPQSLCGGAVVFIGSVVFLPLLAGFSTLITLPLALISAFITAHVFSLARDEEFEAATLS